MIFCFCCCLFYQLPRSQLWDMGHCSSGLHFSDGVQHLTHPLLICVYSPGKSLLKVLTSSLPFYFWDRVSLIWFRLTSNSGSPCFSFLSAGTKDCAISCLRVSVGRGVPGCMNEHACAGQRSPSMSSSVALHLFVWDSLSLNLKLMDLAGPPGHKTLGILHLCWDYSPAPHLSFTWFWRSTLRSARSRSRHCTSQQALYEPSQLPALTVFH